MKVLIISGDGAEDRELFYPYYRLKEEGIGVEVASFSKATITGKRNLEMEVDLTLSEVKVEDYHALILPGGKAPEKLRKDKNVLRITQDFFRQGKPIAAICHGPQIPLSAGLLKGRKATCAPSVREELLQAGAVYQDKEVVVDGNIITSRLPKDLPAFGRELIKKLK